MCLFSKKRVGAKPSEANIHKLGRFGEDVAAKYLRSKGYRIEGRNVDEGFGEIDIVCKTEDILVFVEVKTRVYADELNMPREAVNYERKRRYVSAAEQYLKRRRLHGQRIRFDIIEVITGVGAKPRVCHIEAAF